MLNDLKIYALTQKEMSSLSRRGVFRNKIGGSKIGVFGGGGQYGCWEMGGKNDFFFSFPLLKFRGGGNYQN